MIDRNKVFFTAFIKMFFFHSVYQNVFFFTAFIKMVFFYSVLMSDFASSQRKLCDSNFFSCSLQKHVIIVLGGVRNQNTSFLKNVCMDVCFRCILRTAISIAATSFIGH